MNLGNDYWHAMDRSLAEKYALNPRHIGIPTPPMKDQLESLKTRIFQGASVVELGFLGRDKGSLAQGNVTPEMFGKDEREAIRELAKINEVKLTTHASANVIGFAGLAEGGFRDELREASLHEIERTIDFAADTAGGGPIVLHPGEFQRPISDLKEEKFEGYPGERERAPIYLTDKRTGQIIVLRRDLQVPVPKNDNWENPSRNDDGTIKWKMKIFGDFEDEFNKLTEDERKKYEYNSGKYFYDQYIKKELDLNKGEEKRWALDARRYEEVYNDAKKALDSAEKQFEKNPDAAKYFAMNYVEKQGYVPPQASDKYREFLEDPIKRLKEYTNRVKGQIDSLYEVSRSYGSKAHDTEEQMSNIKPIKEVGVERAAETLSRAAIFAYDVEKERKLKEPLFIAPENALPEWGYGSHPQELKELIIKSREEMINKLTKKKVNGYDNPYYRENISKEEAKRIAVDHIKATFDIGHAYTWRKFFNGTDKEFHDWIGKQVESLTKEGIIGHVHISDNFGYYDEHVTPGEGKAPIAGFIKKLKEQGYKGPMIVEPAHQDYRAMTGAWRTLNSPIYRIDSASVAWTDIEHSYFSRTSSPSYLVGEGIVPEPKEWTLWSGTQLE